MDFENFTDYKFSVIFILYKLDCENVLKKFNPNEELKWFEVL